MLNEYRAWKKSLKLKEPAIYLMIKYDSGTLFYLNVSQMNGNDWLFCELYKLVVIISKIFRIAQLTYPFCLPHYVLPSRQS